MVEYPNLDCQSCQKSTCQSCPIKLLLCDETQTHPECSYNGQCNKPEMPKIHYETNNILEDWKWYKDSGQMLWDGGWRQQPFKWITKINLISQVVQEINNQDSKNDAGSDRKRVMREEGYYDA